MSLDLSTLHIHITYFSDLSIDDLMALIKTAFIWANNYLLKEFIFLIHASAVEIEKNNSVLFIGTSGAGKTTVAKYCYDGSMSILWTIF
jgi:ABC-type polysaccharide/polyol phosphate transport system ATPase subunit